MEMGLAHLDAEESEASRPSWRPESWKASRRLTSSFRSAPRAHAARRSRLSARPASPTARAGLPDLAHHLGLAARRRAAAGAGGHRHQSCRWPCSTTPSFRPPGGLLRCASGRRRPRHCQPGAVRAARGRRLVALPGLDRRRYQPGPRAPARAARSDARWARPRLPRCSGSTSRCAGPCTSSATPTSPTRPGARVRVTSRKVAGVRLDVLV